MLKPKSSPARTNFNRIVWIFPLLFLFPFSGEHHIPASLSSHSFPIDSNNVEGPFFDPEIRAYILNSDLRDLPISHETEVVYPPVLMPLKFAPGTEPKGASSTIANWIDPVAQTTPGVGNMPGLITSFEGMRLTLGGNGWPPDPNGDVGPDHYIQTVNTSMAIYNKITGAEIVRLSMNNFFTGTGTLCDTMNRGDPVVVYDRFEDRWLVTDFAYSDTGGPYYECLALSQSGDPVSGGWYMWGVSISSTSLNDYPKIGVWSDGYYASFNMFRKTLTGWSWDGVQLWAFEKASMLSGVLKSVYFSLSPSSSYFSLLPAHALSEPPVGAPGYYASVLSPNNLQIWKLHADWDSPANSSLTGPTVLSVADFAAAASIPQQGTSILLDSLSYRPMMQLIYRSVDGVESLWMNHTVASQGVAAIRWYEVHNPGGAPSLFQQGTFQPDSNHRWVGSLAVDQDGNMAFGYSISSASIYPAIRFTGRLAGETLGELPQGESTLIQGNGSQTNTTRWGDYSAMSVDPNDDCTFWYTNEYYATSGSTWRTRIGAFRYPFCGLPKGALVGVVRDSVSLQPLADAPVIASDALYQTMSTLSDPEGRYTMTLPGGIYNLTAGPLLPGYPIPTILNSVVVTTGNVTTQDIYLYPEPYLVEGGLSVDDSVPGGNANGYPEPGETDLLLWEGLTNIGAITSTNPIGHLESLDPGAMISVTNAAYPDIVPGQTVSNTTAFVLSVSPSIACGTDLHFRKTITDTSMVHTVDFTLNASIPLNRQPVFDNHVESGAMGWMTGGAYNTWAITTLAAHSPTHSWTDSPGGDYASNTNSYLRTISYNLSSKRYTQLSLWAKYFLEPGYDFVYLDYSLDGGSTWSQPNQALLAFNGFQTTWKQFIVDASLLDGEPNVALRFHMVSDSGVEEDGIYLDDIVLTYEPFICLYNINLFYLPLICNNFSP
jgi:hypothetical protein